MPKRQRPPPGPLGELVEELDLLTDERLLQAWKINNDQLGTLPPGTEHLWRSHQLSMRHYAFRIVAIERFGAHEHVERYRAVLAA